MDNRARKIGICAIFLVMSLYLEGMVSHGIIRHFVQSLPVWPAVWFGFRSSPWTKWVALSPLLLWLFLMINIWLLLLGLPHLMEGTFTRVEIALTMSIGIAAGAGFAIALGIKTAISWVRSVTPVLMMAGVQILALWISFKPGISRDPW